MQRRSFVKYLGMSAGAQLGAGSLQALTSAPKQAATGPAFLFNQLGYLPSQPKILTVRGFDNFPGKLHLLAATNTQPLLEVPLSAPANDALSGDTVRLADFSALTQPGTYTLEAAGQRSDPILIGPTVYADALRSTVRGYYGQRCGCAVDLGHGYRHPPCHLVGAYGPSSGKSGGLPNAGGWHDAGDYGRYVVNSGITCATLLWAWELYPQALQTLELDIPKTKDKLPDFLAEVLWNLQWMFEMQDLDGGVFHKQTSANFCAFIMPQDDKLVSQVIGTGADPYKSTAATADYAAVMAIAARCYAPFDPALAARFLAASRKAWDWTAAHPNVVFRNPPGINTGEYGDSEVSDEFAWASAELWRTTGDGQYEKAFLASLPSDRTTIKIDVPDWGNVGSLAAWTYTLADRPGDPAIKAVIRTGTQQAAEKLIAQAESNGYGNTMVLTDYGWGSNSGAANQSLLLLIAHHLQPQTEVQAAALANLHYLLGRNCFGISWVTGVGTRSFQHPHHRPSAADGIAAPWPGLLSGGPNRHPADPIAKTVPPGPPMRMWIDDDRAYSMNEIAINWNAPLVFLLAAANTMS